MSGQAAITATRTDLATRTTTTRTLLGCGIVAGPGFVAVSLAQAVTRDGFDLARHPWSLLANGDFGWIQTSNLIVIGLAVIALAVGLARVLRPGRAGRWAPRLVAAYGAGMVGAGVFRADPALGFPAGTPDQPAQVSWHGTLHFVTSGIGFICLVVACLLVAGRFAAEGRRGWAAYSRVTAVLFLAGFAGVATGGGSAAANLGFVAAVLLAWMWISAVAVHLYRRTGR